MNHNAVYWLAGHNQWLNQLHTISQQTGGSLPSAEGVWLDCPGKSFQNCDFGDRDLPYRKLGLFLHIKLGRLYLACRFRTLRIVNGTATREYAYTILGSIGMVL